MADTETEIERLITDLDSNDEQAVLALRDLLYREVTARRGLIKRNLKRVFVWFVIMAAFGLPTRFLLPDSLLYKILDGISALVGMFGSLAFVHDVATTRSKIAASLSDIEDTRLVGVFALCLGDKNSAIREAASDALIRLLPKVQASDRQYVSKIEMDALIRAVDKHKYEELTLAILKCFEQIGDERAIPAVEARRQDEYSRKRVRRAAAECLPYLEARAEQTRQAQTLLRASSASEAATETLLRPAQASASPQDEKQLLRPHHPT